MFDCFTTVSMKAAGVKLQHFFLLLKICKYLPLTLIRAACQPTIKEGH